MGRRGAGLLLVGGDAQWEAALRGAGDAPLLGSLPLGYGRCDPADGEAEVAADRLFAALAAASPEWWWDQASEPAATVGFAVPGAPRIVIHQARFHAGDALWLTPLLAAIRGLWPAARSTVVGPPVARPLLAANPDVAELVVFPEDGGAAERRGVLAALAGRRFDAALFAFARRPESVWLAEAAAAAAVAVRVNLEYFDPPLDGLPPSPFTHEARFFWGVQPSPRMLLHALAPLAGPGWDPEAADRRVRLPLPAGAARRAGRRLAELGLDRRPLAVLAPGGRSSARWPADRFAELAGRLAGEGTAVLLTGGPEEAERLADLAAAAPRPRGAAPVVAACDPLPTLAGWLAGARLLVANDSGPIHLAEAAGTPTLYLAQPEKLVHSHPAGPDCWALFDDRHPDPARGALDGVTVDQVAEAAARLGASGLPAARS